MSAFQTEFNFEDIATLKDVWCALVQRSSRRCPHTCLGRSIHSVGICDRVWHFSDEVEVDPIRCMNITVTWELRGPLRSPYSSEALPLAAAKAIEGKKTFFDYKQGPAEPARPAPKSNRAAPVSARRFSPRAILHRQWSCLRFSINCTHHLHPPTGAQT